MVQSAFKSFKILQIGKWHFLLFLITNGIMVTDCWMCMREKDSAQRRHYAEVTAPHNRHWQDKHGSSVLLQKWKNPALILLYPLLYLSFSLPPPFSRSSTVHVSFVIIQDRFSYSCILLCDYFLPPAPISAAVTEVLNLFSYSKLLPEVSCGWLKLFRSLQGTFATPNNVKKQSRPWLSSYLKAGLTLSSPLMLPTSPCAGTSVCLAA